MVARPNELLTGLTVPVDSGEKNHYTKNKVVTVKVVKIKLIHEYHEKLKFVILNYTVNPISIFEMYF